MSAYTEDTFIKHMILFYCFAIIWLLNDGAQSLSGARIKMKKSRKVLIYVLAVIMSFLILPEIVLRTVSGETLVALSEFTSLGGLFSPLLSVMIFIGVACVMAAIIGVYVVSKIYQGLMRVKDK